MLFRSSLFFYLFVCSVRFLFCRCRVVSAQGSTTDIAICATQVWSVYIVGSQPQRWGWGSNTNRKKVGELLKRYSTQEGSMIVDDHTSQKLGTYSLAWRHGPKLSLITNYSISLNFNIPRGRKGKRKKRKKRKKKKGNSCSCAVYS